MGTLKEADKRLDGTLSSEAFAYKDSVSQIVKNHLLKSSLAEDDPKEQLGGKHVDEITQFWSSKIYAFLDDLRSAGAKHTGKLKPTDETEGHSREWKVTSAYAKKLYRCTHFPDLSQLKDETERYRVMYREGPVGTPFHELCLDGVVDGDVASALCVAWESPIFKEWWPNFNLPKFEIVEAKYLKRVRVGQDLSLLRFKIPWPLAQREVVMSAFEVEYLEDDLIIGLVESIPETIELSEKIHGFSKADVPPSAAHVRIDLGGGFVMQRISKDQFYFRTILSMDVKLDFVPPWLINFMSRQVAGQGLKLYQKAVLAVIKGTGSGKAFQKPLKTGQMYERVRSGLEARKEAIGDVHTDHLTERPSPLKDNSKAKSLQGSILRMGSSEYTRVVPYPVKADETKESSADRAALITDKLSPPIVASAPERHRDVEEVKFEEGSIVEIKPEIAGSSKGVIPNRRISLNEEDHREYDDAEVEWAISVLDKMISYTRSCAAEQATAPHSLEIQSSSITSTKEAESKEALVESSGKHPGPSAKKDSCKIVVVKPRTVSKAVQKSDNVELSRSRVLQSAGGDAESSGHSDFWSASEIEVVSSLDDTDTDGGASGSIVTGQPKAQLQVVERQRRRRRWRWTCFSASIMRGRSGHGRTNFYAQGSATASEGNLRSRIGESARYTDDKRYQSARSSLRTRSQSPERFVTLGDMLLDKKR